MTASPPLVSVSGASVAFRSPGGIVRALDGVSMQVRQGETVAVVGESGCGKTTLARVILGLQSLESGSVELNGEIITQTPKRVAEKAGMVWQDPYASLDPRWSVARSALEPLKIVGREGDAADIFKQVGLDPALVGRYPHQLSGGQRQRVAIGRALALKPPLVICDEPTAALDLSIRAQILNLLKDIQRSRGCSFLYISHDLMTVRYLADRVLVMYLGRIVEEGPTEAVFGSPRHPYTMALLDSAPTLEKLRHLPKALPGELPDPRQTFKGCRFASRCPNMQPICWDKDPSRTEEDGRAYYCYFPVNNSEAAVSVGKS